MTALECINVRWLLKARTADIHQRLEAIPCMQRLLQGRLSVEDYGHLLNAYRRFYATAASNLELGYSQLRSAGCTVVAKDAVALIDADLAHLALTSDDGLHLKAPAANEHQSVGWVWVVEGSVLGGIVIDRALHHLFGERRQGRGFFQPQPDMAPRWQNVCMALENYGQTERVCDAVVEGAVAAFECIESSLLGMPR